MKKNLLVLGIFFGIAFSASAQNFSLWGMTQGGGGKALGNIFKYRPGMVADSDVYDFAGWYGANPYGSLFKASDGLFYGTAQQGGPGTNNNGLYFNYDPTSGAYNVLYNFDSLHGRFPTGSLMQASNGLLYGMTYNGGNKNFGVIFSYDIATGKDSVVYYFDSIHGRWPNGTLIQAKDSLLYGMCNGGGPVDGGVVFSLNTKTGQEKVLVNLIGSNGNWPIGDLVQAPNGLLYGMTNAGGASNDGVLFYYNPKTGKDSVKVVFNGVNGGWPYGSLIVASNGLFYGVTQIGGTKKLGAVFSYNTATNKYTVEASFDSAKHGAYLPIGSLVQAPDGLLYGMTNSGGVGDNGSIFQFNTVTNKDSIDVYFNGTDGQLPQYGSLIVLGGSTVGIPAITAQRNNTQIYPNPFTSSALVSFNQTGKHYLEILDIIGKKISSAECDGKEYTLSRNNLSTGVYFVRVFDESNRLVSVNRIVIE
ncbi:MAG TPA: choice-of-anchor tandem repeat GloVer-containing protein [Bacteroidia bacterium]|jgi:uncharacterized repeat protein (TIGR03803 family)|nr:choice-of-anchor tandem repeat GloVer-containing protein [Bacteroidia bacterium]